jgi:hypothetical protein
MGNPGAPHDKAATEHTWSVDSIEAGVARVEEDGTRMLTVPSQVLPAGTTEGHLLRVTRKTAPNGDPIVISIAFDAAATKAALGASARKTAQIARESLKKDRGGDVSL